MKLNKTPRQNVDAETSRWYRDIARAVNNTDTTNASVVQTVVDPLTFSTTSVTFVDIGLSATITTKTNASKVLVTAIICNTYNDGDIAIIRGSTNIAQVSVVDYYQHIPIQFLDSPAAAGSYTYTIQVKSDGSTFYIGDGIGGTRSTLTLQEVKV